MGLSHPILLEKIDIGNRDLWQGIDWEFIRMRDHYNAIRAKGVQYKGVDFDVVKFATPSESRPNMHHEQWIQMVDLRALLDDPEMSLQDDVQLAMAGDLKVHCTCEAFTYFGYKYILTNLDSAIQPETRPPNVRNPKQRGSVCKHLAAVLKVFPFWWNTIASDLRKQGYGRDPSDPGDVAVATEIPAAYQAMQFPKAEITPPAEPTPIPRVGMRRGTLPGEITIESLGFGAVQPFQELVQQAS